MVATLAATILPLSPQFKESTIAASAVSNRGSLLLDGAVKIIHKIYTS